MMDVIESIDKELILIFFGWFLGIASQSISDHRKTKRETRIRRLEAFVSLRGTIDRIKAHMKSSYKISALKLSYEQRTRIASEGGPPELFQDLKKFYHQTEEKSIEHDLREGEIFAAFNAMLQKCVIEFNRDGKILKWMANQKISYNWDILPNFSECRNENEVQELLIAFQQNELLSEMSRIDIEFATIINYLGKKYMGSLIDISGTVWYLQWYAYLKFRFFS